MEEDKDYLGSIIIGVVIISFVIFNVFNLTKEHYTERNKELKQILQEKELVILSQQADIEALSKGVQILTPDNFNTVIFELGFKYPEVIRSQAKWESGLFTQHHSLKLTKNNNLFGMMHPKNRPTTSIGSDSGGFAIYDSWQSSLIDRYIYDVIVLEVKHLDEPQYKKLINKLYSETNNYTDKIQE